MIAEEEAQYLILKKELYDKYPEIEKKYYYFFIQYAKVMQKELILSRIGIFTYHI